MRTHYALTTAMTTIAATVAMTASTLGVGHAAATPVSAAPSVSVDIPSQWLFFSDPFPFGQETIHVARVAPGVLDLSLGPYCTPAYVARRSCTGGPIEAPASVAWINLSTGATGTVSVSALTSTPARITTGRGLIAMGGALAGFGLPGAATITA
ncbi:hypothetical protein GCM10009722_00340 [Williamsia deligens]|nr:hypothetical protein [Williamsia deligens]